MKPVWLILAAGWLTLCLAACAAGNVSSADVLSMDASSATESKAAAASSTEPVEPVSSQEEEAASTMEQTVFYVTVGGSTFAADFADNPGAQAFRELLAAGPVTLAMSDYGGFEKVGGLGQSLLTSNAQTTTQAGDIVLYQGSQVVLFYDSNSWSYTRLGSIRDRTGWESALGGGGVSVRFSLTE